MPSDPEIDFLLESARDHPARAADRFLSLLRAPRVKPGLIAALLRQPALMKIDRLRLAIVLHPATPRPAAMSLLSQLRWRDLARVAVAGRLGAPLRGAAEKILLLRLPELALGERITLARVATVAVLRRLRTDDSPMVMRALLENPLLRLEDAIVIAELPATEGPVLRAIAESHRFAASQDLKLAVATHARTPPDAALRMVHAMDGATLQRLLSRPDAPPLVAIAALRLSSEMGVQGLPNGV